MRQFTLFNNSIGWSKIDLKNKCYQVKLLDDQYDGYDQNKENNTQPNRDVEQRLFNAAPRGENTAGILTGQPTQPNTFTLQHDADNERD